MKKKELTPIDHPLVSTGVPWHTDGYTFTHTCMHDLNVIKVEKKKNNLDYLHGVAETQALVDTELQYILQEASF